MSWLADRISYLAAPWRDLSDVQAQITRLQIQHSEMRSQIMATAEEYAARLDAATNEVASDLQSVRDELAALRDGLEVDKQAAVDAALVHLDAPIARLEALGQDPADPVPGEDGPVPVDEVAGDDPAGPDAA